MRAPHAAGRIGEVVSVQVIPRPHDDLDQSAQGMQPQRLAKRQIDLAPHTPFNITSH